MLSGMVYQKIYENLAVFLPDAWEKLVVYLEYGEEAYTFSFYVKVDGKFIKCYDLPGLDEEQLFRAYREIDLLVEPERNALPGGRWTVMTMLVDSDGKMHTDFDYSDLSSGTYEYRKAWKQRYLK